MLQVRKDPVNWWKWKVDPGRGLWPLYSTLHRTNLYHTVPSYCYLSSQHSIQAEPRISGPIKMPQEACIQIKEELVACVIRSDW